MAYPVYGSVVSTVGIGTALVPTMPAGYQNDDYIFAWVYQDGGTGTLSCATSGWGRHGTKTGNPAGGCYGQWFSAIVASGTVATPTFASTLSDDFACLLFIVRDADTTTPVDVAGAQTDWNLVGNPAAGRPTSTTDGCLVLYGWCSDGNVAIISDINDANVIISTASASSLISASVFFRQQETAGQVAVQQAYVTTAAEGGTQFTICVKNKSGGRLAPDVRLTSDRILSGLFATASAALTWKGPEEVGSQFAGGFTAGALDGITVTTGAVVVTNSGALNAIPTSTTNNRWDGAWHDYTANLDGRVFSVEIRTTRDGSIAGGRIGSGGVIMGFTDGTNYAFFRALSINKTWVLGVTYRTSVCCGRTTPLYSRGTINWTTITGVCYLYHHLNTSNDPFSVGNAIIVDNVAITGGSADDPVSSRDLYLATANNGLVNFAVLNGSSQVLSYFPLQFGDGTNTTHIKNTAVSTEFPQAWSDVSTANWQALWNVPAGAVAFKVKAKATDSINFQSAIFASELQQPFTYDAAGSSSAPYTNVGTSYVGLLPTLLSGVTYNGATFSSCGEIAAKSANLTNCTIDTTTSTNAALSFDANGATLTTSTIDVTGTSAGYHISLGASVTSITLNGNTFTGTPGTDKIYSALASGTLTITWDGNGTALANSDVTFVGGSTAVASVVSPTVERGIAFTGLQTGTSIQVFTSGTQTKLFGDNSTAGSAFAFDDATSGSITVDYTIQKAGYFPQRVTGKVLTGAVGGQEDIQVVQVLDRTYAASSGLTYGTNTVVTVGANPTTAPGTKTFTQSIATTPQNWYSFWIEQWIDLGNATGEALANVAFPLSPNGPNSFTLGNGWTFSDGATSIAFFKRDGLRYLNTSGVLQKAWAAILTSGVPAGSQVRYQQSDAGMTVNAVNTGEMDQLVQIYDVAGADNRGYLVLKVQREGYDQAESNVVTLYGNLEDQLYVVGMTPLANGIATGDPALTITITQGTYVVDGKTFSVKIVDNATPSSGTNILRELRYNFALGGAYQGEDAFNWHDLVQVNGSKFKTVRGVVYGTATTKGVLVYKNDGTTLHPDFDLFTADNGTTYTPPVAAPIVWPGALNATTCLLYNDSAVGSPIIDTQVISGAGGYSLSVTLPSVDVAVGDSLRLRFGHKEYYAGELQGVMTATGLSFVGAMTLHPIYAAWGLNGATYDQSSGGPYTMDGPSLQVDIASGATTGLKTQLGAWTQHLMTLPAGLDAFYGAWDLLAVNQIRQNVGVVDVLIDVPTAGALFEFLDNDVNYYRSDFGFPGNVQAGHGLIAMTYNASIFVPDPVIISGESVVTGDQGSIVAAVRTELATELGRIDVAVSSRLATAGYTAPPSAASNASAVLAAAEVTPIHSDMRKAVGQAYHGDGSEGDKLRSTLVP